MMKTVPLEQEESFRAFVIGECQRLAREHRESAADATCMDRRLRHQGIAQSMQAIADFDPSMRSEMLGSAQACVRELDSCDGATIRLHLVANLRLCMLLGRFECADVGCTLDDLAVATKEGAAA
jgi:hypothetical protein